LKGKIIYIIGNCLLFIVYDRKEFGEQDFVSYRRLFAFYRLGML